MDMSMRNFETKNRYEIADGNGRTLYLAGERSGFWARL